MMTYDELREYFHYYYYIIYCNELNVVQTIIATLHNNVTVGSADELDI